MHPPGKNMLFSSGRLPPGSQVEFYQLGELRWAGATDRTCLREGAESSPKVRRQQECQPGGAVPRIKTQRQRRALRPLITLSWTPVASPFSKTPVPSSPPHGFGPC